MVDLCLLMDNAMVIHNVGDPYPSARRGQRSLHVGVVIIWSWQSLWLFLATSETEFASVSQCINQVGRYVKVNNQLTD